MHNKDRLSLILCSKIYICVFSFYDMGFVLILKNASAAGIRPFFHEHNEKPTSSPSPSSSPLLLFSLNKI